MAFPQQPVGLPWPTTHWLSTEPAADVDTEAAIDAMYAIRDTPLDEGVALATLAVHHGQIVYEQYGPSTDSSTTLISWSMAKSIVHAAFGLLVNDGAVGLDDAAPVREFAGTNKASITIRDLFAMKSGLEFVEDYVDADISHCIDMLFGSGVGDHAHFAASQQLLHKPGAVWNYSSGTTNILARVAGDLVGGGEKGMRDFLHDRLFEPLGMTSAQPKFDEAGSFVGSSYVYATA